jgi:hypothetical protein
MRSADLGGLTRLKFGTYFDLVRVGNELVAALAAEPGFRRITRLELRAVGLGPDGAAALARSPHLTGLKFLSISVGGDLAAKRLGPTGVAALVNSPNLANLTALVLIGQHLGLRGMKALTASRHLAGLRHLDLSANKFTPAMLDALLATKTLTNLISLELHRCDVPPDAVPKLRRKFPHTGIVI